jgi:hypothetical protein
MWTASQFQRIVKTAERSETINPTETPQGHYLEPIKEVTATNTLLQCRIRKNEAAGLFTWRSYLS